MSGIMYARKIIHTCTDSSLHVTLTCDMQKSMVNCNQYFDNERPVSCVDEVS